MASDQSNAPTPALHSPDPANTFRCHNLALEHFSQQNGAFIMAGRQGPERGTQAPGAAKAAAAAKSIPRTAAAMAEAASEAALPKGTDFHVRHSSRARLAYCWRCSMYLHGCCMVFAWPVRHSHGREAGNATAAITAHSTHTAKGTNSPASTPYQSIEQRSHSTPCQSIKQRSHSTPGVLATVHLCRTCPGACVKFTSRVEPMSCAASQP